MNKINTIIFDFDGTIADTKDSIIKTINFTLDYYHIDKLPENTIKNLIGLPISETFKIAIPPNKLSLIDELIVYYRKVYNDISIKHVKLFDNVYETLKILHGKNIKMAISSNKGKKSILNILEFLKIDKYFLKIISEEDVKNKKPDPESVNKIIDFLHVSSSEAILVGDTEVDIMMGKNANCYTCGVTWGNNRYEQLVNRKPDYIINNFVEILSISKVDC